MQLINGTDYVLMPSCEDSRGTDCKIHVYDLSMMWSTIDLIATVFVLIAFVWLRLFEQREIVTIERNLVSPADFTVLVSNLPGDCSEISLRAHFAQLLTETIEEIIFIEDNALDIAMFKMRGDLVKKRYKLTQVSSFSLNFVDQKTSCLSLMSYLYNVCFDKILLTRRVCAGVSLSQ